MLSQNKADLIYDKITGTISIFQLVWVIILWTYV